MCGSRIRRCVPDPCSRSACVHAGACSDAPAAAGSAAVTTVAAAVVVSVIRISAAGGRTGRRHAASGPPPVWGRGHDGAVGRAGQPVHARLRVGVHMADERREPEDGQRLPARRVEDGRRHRPPGRGPPQGRDALAVRRPGGDRRGYRKGHTYPTVVRRTDPKGQLYRSWRLEEPLRLLGLSLDRAGGELNRWVFRASHSRIPEIVELSKKKSGDAAPTSHAPSNRATPAPGSRPSTTGSRPPSAWPTASTASPTSSP